MSVNEKKKDDLIEAILKTMLETAQILSKRVDSNMDSITHIIEGIRSIGQILDAHHQRLINIENLLFKEITDIKSDGVMN